MNLDNWLSMTKEEREKWKADELHRLAEAFIKADANGTLKKVKKPPYGYKWRCSDGACVSVYDGSVLEGVSET